MPIGMTPDQYFEAFVQGNYDDFANDLSCVRKAFNAAISASHMADHYFMYNIRHDPSKISGFETIGAFVNHISIKTNKYFKDIRSIGNAYKHLYTGANPNYSKHSSISSTGSIETVQLTSNNIQIVSEEAAKVVYTKKSGEQMDFFPALKEVVNFWKQKLI